MKKPSSGYVYVASVKNNPNLCKIGYTTKTPSERVKNLSRDYPGHEFELYESFEFDRPKRHEQMAHKLLHQVKLDREMFRVTPVEGCIAVRRTIGKWFDVITASGFDDDISRSGGVVHLSEGNIASSYRNYIKHNLNLEFIPEISFCEFKNIVNTYMELHSVRSAYDINPFKFIALCEEAGI